MPWFRLDSQAMQDEKLIVLRNRHGFEGIGLYFALIMLCYESEGEIPEYKLPILFEAWELENGQKLFDTMLELRLFVKRGEGYYSKRVSKELAIAEEYRNKKVEAGRKGGHATAERLRKEPKQSTATASPKQNVAPIKHNAAPNRTVPNHTLPRPA